MSKPLRVIDALFEKLKQIENVPIYKNEPLPQKIPNTGIVFLRDGDLGEPEVLLSPLIYIYNHKIEIEIIVQALDSQERDVLADKILMKVYEFVNQSPTLDGSIDYLSFGTPEFLLEAPEGTVPIKAIILPIYLEYTTQNILT
ncbi:MAG: hypothetical protein R3Y43_04255 [Alphaproteobacteria bacterium]